MASSKAETSEQRAFAKAAELRAEGCFIVDVTIRAGGWVVRFVRDITPERAARFYPYALHLNA